MGDKTIFETHHLYSQEQISEKAFKILKSVLIELRNALNLQDIMTLANAGTMLEDLNWFFRIYFERWISEYEKPTNLNGKSSGPNICISRDYVEYYFDFASEKYFKLRIGLFKSFCPTIIPNKILINTYDSETTGVNACTARIYLSIEDLGEVTDNIYPLKKLEERARKIGEIEVDNNSYYLYFVGDTE